jgi:hypothetical protein
MRARYQIEIRVYERIGVAIAKASATADDLFLSLPFWVDFARINTQAI